MDTLASEYNALHYEDEQITKKIIDMVDEKVDDIFYSLEDVDNLKLYKYEVTDTTEPQTVLKVYRVINNVDEYYKELVLVVDVEICDNTVWVTCYDIERGKTASAEFINGEMGMVDGVPTPIQETEFNTKNIENLLDNIYSEFCS